MEALIRRIKNFIFLSERWKFILTLSAITLFKTGIWYIPNLDTSRAIAQNPFVNPFTDPNRHYLFWNWLGPFVAWLIGATGKSQFFAFHFVFSIAYTLLFAGIVFASFSDEAARSAIVLFSILPVSATAYFWVGTDSITLFLMLLALAFPQARALTFAIGILLGMQHFEQSFFAASGLLFSVFLSNRQGYTLRYPLRFCVFLLLGVIAGKLALVGIFKYHAIEVNSGRMYWLREYLGFVLIYFFFHFHYILWSVLGLGWMVAVRFMDWGRNSIPFLMTLAGLCLLLAVSADQTRVLAIITFPLVAAYWLLNRDFLERLSKSEVSLLFSIWVITPWGWVWGGTPKWSVFPYDIAYVLHRMFGWFDVPGDPALWPFL